MAKHKKTLAQKKKSDNRKNYSPSQENPTGLTRATTFSLPEYSFVPQKKTASVKEHSHSSTHGLRKTIILSSVIVIVQLAFFFSLTHHILILPWKAVTY